MNRSSARLGAATNATPSSVATSKVSTRLLDLMIQLPPI
jgi:hypothetical protein